MSDVEPVNALLRDLLRATDPIRAGQAVAAARTLLCGERRISQSDAAFTTLADRVRRILSTERGGFYSWHVVQALRSLDTASAEADERSLASELAAVLVAATLLYHSALPTDSFPAIRACDPDPGGALGLLVDVRLTGGRSFLHPGTDVPTLPEQRGRYLFARLLIESVCASLLDELGLPAWLRLYATLSDNVLLIPVSEYPRLVAAVARLAQQLQQIYPTLGLITIPAEVSAADMAEGTIAQRIRAVNRRFVPKAEERVGFAQCQEGDSNAALRVYLQELSRCVSTGEFLTLCRPAHSERNRIPGCLERLPYWCSFSTEQAGASGYVCRTDDVLAEASLHEGHPLMTTLVQGLVAGSVPFGVLRLDADGFLESLLGRAPRRLAGVLRQSWRLDRYFRQRVPWLVRQFVSECAEGEQVLLLHSSSDDIVAAGPANSLLRLSSQICADYRRTIGASMSWGVGVGRPGMSLSSISREALTALVRSKSAPNEHV